MYVQFVAEHVHAWIEDTDNHTDPSPIDTCTTNKHDNNMYNMCMYKTTTCNNNNMYNNMTT